MYNTIKTDINRENLAKLRDLCYHGIGTLYVPADKKLVCMELFLMVETRVRNAK